MSDSSTMQSHDSFQDLEKQPIVVMKTHDANKDTEHDQIDERYIHVMDEQLQDIRHQFIVNIPSNRPSSPMGLQFPYSDSNSPLTISANNSDSEDDVPYKETTYEQMKDSLDKYFDDSESACSNELDILITYMKGQKNLYIQSYLLSQRKLNMLMIPAIIISAAVSVFAPILEEESWTILFICCLNAFNAMLISMVNYLKLETSTQTFFTTATQFDKLETLLEFVASKIIFVDKESEKSDIIYDKIQEVERKIHEIKEWNTLFVPDEIRGIFPIICHINIFSFIKRMEASKKSLIHRFKDVKNEIKYILTRAQKKHDQARIEKRLQVLNETKEKIKEELAHYRNAYSYIDEIFTIEIKNARNTSLWAHFFLRGRQETCNLSNPVVDRYIHCITCSNSS